ncbi:maltose alpha-D-glucosyltransferase [Terriglobus roseus]|uniref:Maltokinase n=1 Tax=Terriglobus roseus TaxID=392734 RepID=A0A1G7LTZ4_9BACT|nr:maltose alpha-D-glucosyltransferase [Terriglobus roseus]SDF52824.1 maltose alpha-D-glucosyltransferase/ alpha-amylase [Terriglobus roseus]
MSTTIVRPKRKKSGSATDPLWFKDAVIYELHVKAFADSNNDGIGDFPGLMGKLDYLQELGVTCIWLLPFFPSPQRDDGYDISDYLSVNPAYGTVNDFQSFLAAAHARGMQVMIELVINHTSDQHPWFQAARNAPAGSPERNMYVWSDSDKLYDGVRIIFTDTEKSNWTWDAVAGQYYWHRFFSHQPDLNFDNPVVRETVADIMRYWLDMGVDGLRLDAIPYLIERDGTSCENVPETHLVIKELRAVMESEYENRMILAEANMWPEDVRPYFGDGDECHMAFHFPLMPRIYMALRQEDRLPITEIMARTPDIPSNCQWGIFLRNHDELTLEMVSDDERDYMYLAYSADPRMRINVGIRRRLAPLLDNNRRRIELLNSLLLSFPGTPILYYGDEIGMGDNIYLGDRNGVRTPMQWNSDRNAGFSRAVPAKLYSPVIMDPIWGYEAINVEAQESDTSSLLHWTRNMIALRKLFQVFGRGTQEFLRPENRKVLAYLREYESERVVCVANLSRFAQPVTLDLSRFKGMVPVEMLGYVSFPKITDEPYPVTLGPYAFLWLELQPAPQDESETPSTLDAQTAELVLPAGNLQSATTGAGAELLQETFLPKFLLTQRWFGAKSRTIKAVHIVGSVPLQRFDAAILILGIDYMEGNSDTYTLPVAYLSGERVDSLRAESPQSIIASAQMGIAANGALVDGLFIEEVRQELLRIIGTEQTLVTDGQGILTGKRSSAFASLRGPDENIPSRRTSAEQSNSSLLYGAAFILKLFRRLQPGENPDAEIGRFLTETAHFQHIAPFAGELLYTPEDGETTTLGLLQGLVANEGDGWEWTLSQIRQSSNGSSYTDAIRLLGQRTGEMHGALATPTDNPAFAVETTNAAALDRDAARLESQITIAIDAFKTSFAKLSDALLPAVATLISRRDDMLALAESLRHIPPAEAGIRTRIHGDYHLGQVLRTKDDFVLLDFEGEPARSLEERRMKQSPLRDVAGMLRSFSYAAAAGFGTPPSAQRDEWEHAAAGAFLEGYRQGTGSLPHPSTEVEAILLRAYLLEKALYEIIYEVNNRPDWIAIPLAGILGLLDMTGGRA